MFLKHPRWKAITSSFLAQLKSHLQGKERPTLVFQPCDNLSPSSRWGAPKKQAQCLTSRKHSVGVCWVRLPPRIVGNREGKKESFRLRPANHTFLLRGVKIWAYSLSPFVTFALIELQILIIILRSWYYNLHFK